MNKTLALPNIVARLTELAHTDEQTASAFVNEFVTLVEETLAAGEEVTIKQIGTFAPGWPIDFTPAQELAEAVNAPFAMFECVELPDEYEEESGAESKANHMAETDDATDEMQPEKCQSAPPAEDVTPDDGNKAKEYQAETATEECDIEQQPVQDRQTLHTTGPVEICEPEPAARHSRPIWPKILAALLAGLIIGGGTGFIAGLSAGDRNRSGKGSAPVAYVTDGPAAEARQAEPTPTPAPEPVTAPATEPERYDTISTRRFLTTMARKYYGRMEYWVYIYEENAAYLDNPNRISPGTRVKIPPFEKYAVSTNDSANLAEARAKAARIYEKYQ